MPLFGSSHKHDNKLEKHNPATAADLDSAPYGNNNATGTGAGVGRHEAYLASGQGAAGTGTVGMGEPGMGNPATAGGDRHHAMGGPQAGMDNNGMPPAGMRNDGMTAGQPGQQYTGGPAGGAAIPPTGSINNQQQNSSGGGGAMTGKIEHAVGSLVGSNALKAKGLPKEQEAQGLKVQSTELAEAERLEREAGLRRERAVAHGAHPDNKHLGGGGRTGPGAYD
ncbi:hypothetical protein DFH07DRAFT_1065229 [Mycena maculata]|uniref:Uncharacterized protein n=1 Tax=Mycena maculata TaxID=230809 RepID=A0AAD7MX25_9AGAR|nr:hypothetical protein DFH07DRAFT_1065229 [Mycena maculata]